MCYLVFRVQNFNAGSPTQISILRSESGHLIIFWTSLKSQILPSAEDFDFLFQQSVNYQLFNNNIFLISTSNNWKQVLTKHRHEMHSLCIVLHNAENPTFSEKVKWYMEKHFTTEVRWTTQANPVADSYLENKNLKKGNLKWKSKKRLRKFFGIMTVVSRMLSDTENIFTFRKFDEPDWES